MYTHAPYNTAQESTLRLCEFLRWFPVVDIRGACCLHASRLCFFACFPVGPCDLRLCSFHPLPGGLWFSLVIVVCSSWGAHGLCSSSLFVPPEVGWWSCVLAFPGALGLYPLWSACVLRLFLVGYSLPLLFTCFPRGGWCSCAYFPWGLVVFAGGHCLFLLGSRGLFLVTIAGDHLLGLLSVSLWVCMCSLPLSSGVLSALAVYMFPLGWLVSCYLFLFRALCPPFSCASPGSPVVVDCNRCLFPLGGLHALLVIIVCSSCGGLVVTTSACDFSRCPLYTYVHTYIPTYLHTYVPTYLHTYLPTYIHTYIHPYIHTYINTYTHHVHTYIHARIHTCMA